MWKSHVKHKNQELNSSLQVRSIRAVNVVVLLYMLLNTCLGTVHTLVAVVSDLDFQQLFLQQAFVF